MAIFPAALSQYATLGASFRDMAGIPAMGPGVYADSNIYRAHPAPQPDWLAAADLLQPSDIPEVVEEKVTPGDDQ